ncbi:cupin [Synechococcus sp. A10-1-5-1]|uniref:cupin n=1 Tax=Synechococcus sp. A10-1-5-1 TaxID=2936507 RepID=UPI0020018F3F|nr:cupin [Synechococcus sp. A10-1-5-1]UPM50689.1 cupin [Synechococcus sp. A10-1-5-1]
MTQTPDRPSMDCRPSVQGEDLQQSAAADKAELFDYREAANPIRSGLTEPIPYCSWGPELHASGPSGIIPLDLSAELGASGPATSPGLAAHFIRIEAGEGVRAAASATSSLFFVLSGRGICHCRETDQDTNIHWSEGDLFVLPSGGTPLLEASSTSVLYWVHDAPLLNYLGVVPSQPRFEATHYRGEWLRSELRKLAQKPGSANSNRISLLLANRDLPSTRTVTHVLWAMYGIVPSAATQPPHRHQSVALDLIIDCQPGVYTLVGTELNADGTIRNPKRINWQAGGAFITPPGYWHSHVNESGHPAYLLPIQDAGLQTYLRSLDIRFA